MINCKDQVQDATDLDLFIDWDALSRSDEMGALTPESSSTSFSTYEPAFTYIPTEELIPRYYYTGSMSPDMGSAGYEALQNSYEHMSGNSPAQVPASMSSDDQSSGRGFELLDPVSGQNDQRQFVLQSCGPVAEHTSIQYADGTNDFWQSSQTQPPFFPSQSLVSEPLPIREPPQMAPWCPLDIPQNGISPLQGGSDFNINNRFQPADETPSQQILSPTGSFPATTHNHASYMYQRGILQANFQSHNSNAIAIQQSRFGSSSGLSYTQVPYPQSATNQLLSNVGDDIEASMHMSQRMVIPSSGPIARGTTAVSSVQEDHNFGLGSAVNYCSSSLSPQQFPAVCSEYLPSGQTSEGTSPSSSLSPNMRCEGRTKGGGRKRGSSLKQTSKANAHTVRVIGSCWRCSLRRDACGEGSPCRRCLDKPASGSSLRGIECTRVKLKDLGFIPPPLLKMYGRKRVAEFRSIHINGRTGRSFKVLLSVGRDLETFDCDMCEFSPKDEKSQNYTNYYSSSSGKGMTAETKTSANLELESVSESDKPRYNEYLDRLLDSTLRGKSDFARTCYAGEDSKFAERLLKLLFNACRQIELQVPGKSAPREHLQLIISTYIVSRNITFKENTATASPTFQSSRMANKQLKYFFFQIMASQYQNMLNEMQQQLRKSCNVEQLTSLVYAILCLGMSLDILLRYIYLTADHMKTQSSNSWGCAGDDVIQKAESYGQKIENGFDFIVRIFQVKYRKMNPFENPGSESWAGRLKPAETDLFCRIECLIRDNSEYLKARQLTRLSMSNLSSCTSRLVSKFLLSMRPLS